jgi:metal-responsive CopG/Arc/MetJ family transcriptional regulator
MLDIANMPAQAVQISLDADLLKRIDSDSEVKKKGRSAFIRDALRVYLRARELQKIDEHIRSAYAGQADALAAEVADLLRRQTWPEE